MALQSVLCHETKEKWHECISEGAKTKQTVLSEKTNNTSLKGEKSVSHSFSDNDMRQHTSKSNLMRPIAKISHR